MLVRGCKYNIDFYKSVQGILLRESPSEGTPRVRSRVDFSFLTIGNNQKVIIHGAIEYA